MKPPPSLLMLHGFTGGPSSFAPLLPRLPEGTSVLRPELLGHGAAWRERLPSSLTFDAEVERIAEALRRLPVPPVVLGYSLGGRLALRLAAQVPERLHSLVVVGAHPGLPSSEERRMRRAADQAWISHLRDPSETLESFAEAWAKQPVLDTEPPVGTEDLQERRRAQRALRLSHDREGLALAMEVLGLAEMSPVWNALTGWKVPTVWMAGEEDGKFSALAQEASTRCRLGRCRIVPGAGHNVLLERPEAVAEVLRGALAT